MSGMVFTGSLIKKAMADNPPMTRAEELVVARAAVRGCKTSADRLVLCNLGIAILRAGKYQRRDGPPSDDILQCAVLGLMRAVQKFDPERGFRFSTYAHDWIRAALDAGIGLQWPLIRTASTRALRWGRTGQLEDPLHVVSFDAPIGDTKATFHEVLPGLDAPVDDELHRKERCAKVRRCLAYGFTKRELAIIRGRLMLDDKEKLEVIGKRYGVSRERIRQIEQALLPRLRRRLASLAA